MILLDASLLVASIAIEDMSHLVVDWMTDQQAGSLAVSEWGLTECASALSFKVRTGQMSEQFRQKAQESLNQLLAESLTAIAVPPQSFATARSYFSDSSINLRSGDSLHLAVAHLGGHSLATLDKALASAATAFGIDVVKLA